MSADKQMRIGKINLDLTYYPGEDLYCDGAIEDELLDIVKNYAEVEYPKIIEERKRWEVLYHLSSHRENIVDWLPIEKNMKVLEVGSGCGAITGSLARKAGYVTSIDLSKKRSMINAYRHENLDNITIHVGNFQDIEPDLPADYDYICLIGVFEYGQAYISTQTPYESFLEILQKHLKKDGRIVIAIENRFGLKYWAGCREDHLGSYFSGIENYPNGGVVRTFTKNALEKIFQKCGMEQYYFYYPYPDYKLMTTLYSDAYLPKQGELSNNLLNFDQDRMLLFDEKKAFDGIIKDDLFSEYSNSFLVVLGKELPVKYAKYSNDRHLEYQIRTEICLENLYGYQEGKSASDPNLCQFVVRKYPLTEYANEHIEAMEKAYQQLKERFQGGEIKINRCKLVKTADQLHDIGIQETDPTYESLSTGLKPYVEFEFLRGITLTELMDQSLEVNDFARFMELFRHYLEILDYHNEMPIADFDLVFSNIIISEKDPHKTFDPIDNAKWTLIDYEWTFGKRIPTKELAFRAVYCYLLEDPKRDKLNFDLILKELMVSDEEAEEYRKQEEDFQRYVTGNRKSMVEIRKMIGHHRISPEDCIKKVSVIGARSRVQIYEDCGEGYSEENSYFYDLIKETGDVRSILLEVDKNVKQIRFDLTMHYSIISLKSIKINEREINLMDNTLVSTNGIRIGEGNVYLFTTTDPNVNISLSQFSDIILPEDDKIEIEAAWETALLTESMAEQFEKANQPKRRFHW